MSCVLVPIGDFSRMTHLSVKALRHYHDQGLLEPAEVDPMTGYRFYDPDQVPVAQVIRRFRDLGMPLEQLKTVLQAPDLETRNREIVAHLTVMERQLTELHMSVASLRALLDGAPARLPVEFRSIPATEALALRGVVNAEGFAEWWVEAFQELYAAVDHAGLHPAGPGGALYPAEFFELEAGEVTAFVPVTGPCPATGRTEPLIIPAVEVAVMLHAGPLGDLDQTYGALGTVVAERAIGVEGPIREYYLVSFADTADESRHRTEICWPVFQTSVASQQTP